MIKDQPNAQFSSETDRERRKTKEVFCLWNHIHLANLTFTQRDPILFIFVYRHICFGQLRLGQIAQIIIIEEMLIEIQINS